MSAPPPIASSQTLFRNVCSIHANESQVCSYTSPRNKSADGTRLPLRSSHPTGPKKSLIHWSAQWGDHSMLSRCRYQGTNSLNSPFSIPVKFEKGTIWLTKPHWIVLLVIQNCWIEGSCHSCPNSRVSLFCHGHEMFNMSIKTWLFFRHLPIAAREAEQKGFQAIHMFTCPARYPRHEF